jgi:hypothetical protein
VSDNGRLHVKSYDKANYYFTQRIGAAKQVTKRLEMKNSDVAFFNEYRNLLKRKEYTHVEVKKYFESMPKANFKKVCHNCGKNYMLFMSKLIKRSFCNFCLEYVCDKDCLCEEKFIIPRNFNIEYDLNTKHVCRKAAVLLNRKNYIKI